MSATVAVSVLQQVWDDLVATLATITTGNGYHHTVLAESIYTDMVSLPLVPLAPAVVIGPTDGAGRLFRPAMRLQESLVFALEARVDATEQVPKTIAFTRFVADLERALTQDGSRGGVAIDTRVRPPVGPFVGYAPQSQVLFSMEIDVRVKRAYGAS